MPFFRQCGCVQSGQNNCITHVQSTSYGFGTRIHGLRKNNQFSKDSRWRAVKFNLCKVFACIVSKIIGIYISRSPRIQIVFDTAVANSFRISNCTVSSVLQTGSSPTFCGSQNSIANIE